MGGVACRRGSLRRNVVVFFELLHILEVKVSKWRTFMNNSEISFETN